MRLQGIKKQILSAFVMTFLCLNAAGMLCLTYCLHDEGAAAAQTMGPDHCGKIQAPEGSEDEDQLAGAESASCCSMPVSLLAVAIEKRNPGPAAAEVSAAVIEKTKLLPAAVLVPVIPYPSYGRPMLDGRSQRIKNCVIRI